MIRRITAAQTRPLRQAVLRPQQAAEELVYPGDDDPRTVHLGAFAGDRLVGIASIYVEAMPGASGVDGAMPEISGVVVNPGAVPDTDPGAAPAQSPAPAPNPEWRLRGMATLPEARGTGLGGALLEACIDHIRDQGGTRLWCNARTTAAGFYLRYRFTTHGDEFDLPGIGPHYRMSREILRPA